MSKWVGFDFDGTLAEQPSEATGFEIGATAPVARMVDKAKKFLASGTEVRILTARVSRDLPMGERTNNELKIKQWCMEHLGQVVRVTSEKDYQMAFFYDDLAVQVIQNTGITLANAYESLTDMPLSDVLMQCWDAHKEEKRDGVKGALPANVLIFPRDRWIDAEVIEDGADG